MKRAPHTSRPPIIRWLGRGAFMASAGFLYLMAALAALAILVPLGTGMRSTVIVSGSMRPSLAAGDVVLVADHDGDGLGAGTVVMFPDPARPQRLVTHRIVGVNQDGSYQTAGDANAHPDSTPLPPDQVVGVGRAVIPAIGLPALWLRVGRYSELGVFVVVMLAAYTFTRWFARWDQVGSTRREDSADGLDLAEGTGTHRHPDAQSRPKELVGHLGLLAPLLAVTLVASTTGSSEAGFLSATSNPGNSLLAAPSFNTIEFVQTIGSASCGGTSSVIAVPAGGVPVGDTLLVRVALRSSSAATAVTATDTAGNTYSVDADASSGNRIRAVVLSAHVDFALAGSDNIVVSHANGRAESAVVEHFSGIAAIGRVEAAGTGAGHSTTPSASVASGGGEVLLYGAVANYGNLTHTEADGWTTLALLPVNCTRRMDNAAGFQIVDTTGLSTYQTTLSGSRWWAEGLIAYRGG